MDLDDVVKELRAAGYFVLPPAIRPGERGWDFEGWWEGTSEQDKREIIRDRGTQLPDRYQVEAVRRAKRYFRERYG